MVAVNSKPLLYFFCLVSIAIASPRDIYTRYFPDRVITFDPLFSAERYSQHIILQMYDPLFRLEDGLTPRPHLAKSFRFEPATNTYYITLKENVFFNNGRQFTSDDVIFTLKRSCRIPGGKVKVPPLIRGCISSEAFGARALGPFEIAISLVKAYPPFISLLASPQFMILPKDFGGKTEVEFLKQPIGTGPFAFESASNSEIILNRNERYFLGPAKIRKLVYYIEPESKIYRRVDEGNIDDIFPLPPPSRFSNDFEIVTYNTASTVFLGFQPGIPPFNNIKVRMAIRAAIDNYKLKPLLDSLGDFTIARGVIPWGAIGFDAQLPDNYFNPLSIPKLLQTTRYKTSRGIPEFVLYSALKPPLTDAVAENVVTQLKAAGFRVKVVHQTLPELMLNIRKGNVGMMLISPTMSSVDTYQFLQLWHSEFENPALNLHDKEVDQMLKEALSSPDRLVRSNIYTQINRLLAERAYTHNIAYISRQRSLRRKHWIFPKLDILGPFFMQMYGVRRES